MTNTIITENRFAKVYTIQEHSHVLVCELQGNYIPEQNFKELFNAMTDVIKSARFALTTLVFDKRSLTTFHQASMTWYHVEWKPEMLKYGLAHYRKILPKDNLFRKSVEIGRSKISTDYPTFDFTQYDIKYCETIEEAVL